MKEYSYKSYKYNSFFEHYFKHSSSNPVGNVPEKILTEYKPLLPSYVNTILNFGCANGRDFIPFQNDFNCIGFDLAPTGYIDWVCKTDNLIYYQCSIEDYLNNFKDDDLSNYLVYTQGTLMYLTPENQNKFIKHLLDRNCKNIILHEYPPTYSGPHPKFTPEKKYLDMFEQVSYRKNLIGFVFLDK